MNRNAPRDEWERKRKKGIALLTEGAIIFGPSFLLLDHNIFGWKIISRANLSHLLPKIVYRAGGSLQLSSPGQKVEVKAVPLAPSPRQLSQNGWTLILTVFKNGPAEEFWELKSNQSGGYWRRLEKVNGLPEKNRLTFHLITSEVRWVAEEWSSAWNVLHSAQKSSMPFQSNRCQLREW